ncbi:protein BONZAI 3-like isoform X1 [Hordeum vulgare subsp. vulgare]|uniref:C2 domain-containing protein n=1 Tax=Hordeum vulgare subsp. vulgare TaxID=112509 RepID=A0A8I6XQQ0_HORVV|nr:protein BONZAI 3-like isoform X1 [Hordeum vulgare subsp. vulgare]
MGGCFSGDVRGGTEPVGVGARAAAAGQGQGGPNEAVDHFLQGHGLRGLYTPLELSFSASKLRDMDALSKSDPMLVVYTKMDGRLEEIGRTEVILNSLEPLWITKTMLNYQFEIVQPLVFRIYDIDTKYHNTPVKMLNLAQQDFLGEAFCNLSEIVTKFNHSLTLNLRNGSGHALQGTMTVHTEETASSRTAVEMTFHCLNLDNKDTFSKSDPFLRISRLSESAVAIPICKTEVINNNLNPVWRPITLTSQQYSSRDDPLLVECFDFDASGDHELMGALQATIAQLENLYKSKAGANFYSHKGQKKLKGQLFLDTFLEKVQHTFLDYISSGFELNFMVAVDFTASNGDPRTPQSLHYIDPSGRLNSYQQAILEVSEVLQFYDKDRRFPAWGFGARIPQGSVSHCFNLNASTNDCEVVGFEGIMSAYSSTLYTVSLAGPTLFGPVINKAAEIASHSVQYVNNKYFVLLIITDGVITDEQETKDSIVRASDLPLSILIVGVGSADFTQMRTLDADLGKRLQSSTGRVATRDIVQFVPMREVQAGGQVTVVQSLLEELPGQFLEYMRTRGIKPRPPQHASASPAYPPPPPQL